MSEEKKATAAESVKQAPPAELADAAGSPDAGVQILLALRHNAEQNGDKQAADAVTAQLAELGYR